SLPKVETVVFSEDGSVTNNTIFFYFQYLPYIFVLILFVGMAPILVLQNEKDMKARTDVSCLPSKSRSFQSFLAGGLLALCIWIAFVVVALILFGKDFFNARVYLAMANSFVFVVFSVAITLLVSVFAPNENMVNILANVIGLSMSFLCGVFVPQSMLSEKVLAVAKFLPCYWYIANNDMLSGASSRVFETKFFWQCIGIQALFAVAMFAITFSFSRARKRAQ
ncbi:MAG: ABC transporter permease, partial [Lachnospiraceae bacterium]|nr:ABC transporter permease [Lachnospiraceae bacterium]